MHQVYLLQPIIFQLTIQRRVQTKVFMEFSDRDVVSKLIILYPFSSTSNACLCSYFSILAKWDHLQSSILTSLLHYTYICKAVDRGGWRLYSLHQQSSCTDKICYKSFDNKLSVKENQGWELECYFLQKYNVILTIFFWNNSAYSYVSICQKTRLWWWQEVQPSLTSGHRAVWETSSRHSICSLSLYHWLPYFKYLNWLLRPVHTSVDRLRASISLVTLQVISVIRISFKDMLCMSSVYPTPVILNLPERYLFSLDISNSSQIFGEHTDNALAPW